MNQQQWITIDIDKMENPPLHLVAEDRCCFLREYTSGGGFGASEGNDDISNFKKNPSLRDTQQWKWKERAAQKFARELSILFKDGRWNLCMMPSSRILGDPEYDPRFDMMLDYLRPLCPNLTLVSPIKKKTNTQPLHVGGGRDVPTVYRSLEWTGFHGRDPEVLLIVDDMITCGTTYKACKQLLIENSPRIQIMGVFWTRCIWKGDVLSAGDVN